METVKYAVICKGALRAGVDKAGAIAKLVAMTGRTHAEIEARLLSGRESVLKRTEDHKLATGLCERFRAAGLDVDLREIEANAIHAQGSGAAAKGTGQTSARRTSWPRRTLVLLLLLAMVFGGSISALYWWLQRDPPASVLQAEAALADGSLVALVHVDVKRIAVLERFWVGAPDPKTLPMPDRVQGLLAGLTGGDDAGWLDLRQLLFAVNADKKGRGANVALLLFGQFDAPALERALARHYSVAKEADGHWRLHANQEADPNACPDQARPEQDYYLSVSADRVLGSDSRPGLDALEHRLRAGGGARQDLAVWRAYRKGKLASAKVWSPRDLGEAVGGMGEMLLRQSAGEHAAVTEAYVGLRLVPEAWALDVNAWLLFADPAWLDKTYADWNGKLAALRERAGQVAPALRKVAGALSVTRAGEALNADLRLNDQVTGSLRDAVGEILAGMFSIGSPNGDTTAQAEQIDPSPWDYARNAVLRTLPDFDPEDLLFFRPEWRQERLAWAFPRRASRTS